MPLDSTYNVEAAWDKCMDCLDEALDILVYVRLGLALKLDLTNDVFPVIFPLFDPSKTIGKYQ